MYIESYNSSKLSSYLMNFDVSNLYRWAMCQPLPFADFRWVDDIFNFNVMYVALDSPTGYIFETNSEYSQHFHDAHANLPFCPTLNKSPGKHENKLLATLYDKKRYIIHYTLLKLAAMYSSWSSGDKDSSRITRHIHAISMASRLYSTKYRFQNSRKQ